MKKIISIAMCMAILVSSFALTGITASAAQKTYKSSNCVYTLDKKGNATVTNVNGRTKNGYWIIPSKIKGHKVTKIALSTIKNLVNGKSSSSKIRIPKTVTYISSTFKKLVNYKINNQDKFYLVCYKGSYAQKYALKNEVLYKLAGETIPRGDVQNLALFEGYKFYFKDKNYSRHVFDGKAYKPKFSFKEQGVTLKEGRDYKVRYDDNIGIGWGTACVVGIGNYSGIVASSFHIIPSTAVLKSVTKNDTGVNCDYEKLYYLNSEIQYSTSENFSKSTTTTIDKKDMSDGNIVFDFEAGKTYYFRARYYYFGYYLEQNYYSDPNKDYYYWGNTSYGDWSNVVKVDM